VGEIDFERADEEQGGHAFRVIGAYARWLMTAGREGERQVGVLRLLGLFDRPADPGCMEAVRGGEAIVGLTEGLGELDTQGWRALISSLERMRLVSTSVYELVQVSGYDEEAAKLTGATGQLPGEPKPWRPRRDFGPNARVIDAHPLVREYFARELRQANETAWCKGHLRLYEHLCASVPYWPEGIVGLLPLYQAVVHGCTAGRVQEVRDEVYGDRIWRGAIGYSTKYLGAISADLACVGYLFDRLWDRAPSR
jgi:hypothetical protein